MSKILNIILGIILILAPILISLNWLPSWWFAAIEFLKGGVIVVLVLIGIVLLVLGVTE